MSTDDQARPDDRSGPWSDEEKAQYERWRAAPGKFGKTPIFGSDDEEAEYERWKGRCRRNDRTMDATEPDDEMPREIIECDYFRGLIDAFMAPSPEGLRGFWLKGYRPAPPEVGDDGISYARVGRPDRIVYVFTYERPADNR